MHQWDRVIDRSGQQYAIDRRTQIYDYDAVCTYPIYANGHVGPPFYQPLEGLQPLGVVYLRHNRSTWFITDRKAVQARVATRRASPSINNP